MKTPENQTIFALSQAKPLNMNEVLRCGGVEVLTFRSFEKLTQAKINESEILFKNRIHKRAGYNLNTSAP